MLDVAVIGGGAAGFFAAINIKILHPDKEVQIFEKSSTCLGKVKISGGGRCNVTHHCFDPVVLSKFYPRGSKELISVFNRFNPQNTIDWFEQQGIRLKTESDGRMFPITDDSQTIINCFVDFCKARKVAIHTRTGIKSITKKDNHFELQTETEVISCRKLVVSSGSSEVFWNLLAGMGHDIIPPVPSLFTFNIINDLIEDLPGLSVPKASVKLNVDKSLLKAFKLSEVDCTQSGPLLITHWGLSGPAILKLSSIAARLLHHLNYQFEIQISFSNLKLEETLEVLMQFKSQNTKKQIINTPLFDIPIRWWNRLHALTFENTYITWSDISKKDLNKLALNLCAYPMKVDGKSTFKDEFVTAGGVNLKEVDFKTMESKIIPGMYFAGEVLNIDALTGGFNFQAAWSEAWVISRSIFN